MTGDKRTTVVIEVHDVPAATCSVCGAVETAVPFQLQRCRRDAYAPSGITWREGQAEALVCTGWGFPTSGTLTLWSPGGNSAGWTLCAACLPRAKAAVESAFAGLRP